MSALGKRAMAAAAAALSFAAPPLLAQPATLRNASVTVQAAGPGGLARRIAELASSPTPIWIGWAAPAANGRSWMCCEGEPGRHPVHADGTPGCGPCRLEHEDAFSMQRDEDSSPALEGHGDFLLFARMEKGRLEKLRSFSFDCAIDGGGMPVAWIDGVRPEDGIAWLESLVPKGRDLSRPESDEDDEDGDERGVVSAAVAAIALHAGAAADRSLERLIAPARPIEVRKKAVFWLAAARGREGCQRVESLVPPDTDSAFRRHGTFALSLCHEPASTGALLSMARHDPAARVRGQALFWLAQRAGRRAAETIQDAIRDDPDTEVKKQAVFALTQMPEGEGVPELIRVARTNRNPEVRERAMFWLGQTQDPRALDFIEGILTK